MRIDLSKCKSDPERLLARALNEIPEEVWPVDWTVVPQGEISVDQQLPKDRIAQYDLRVDFLFKCFPSEEDPFRPFMRVAVEVDSRAFHDLMPEQIEKDRWRDRRLADLGVFMLRYSSSHIMRDPKAVADEIHMTLEGLYDNLDPLHWLVEWGDADKSLERYRDLVNARITKMIERFRKYARKPPAS